MLCIEFKINYKFAYTIVWLDLNPFELTMYWSKFDNWISKKCLSLLILSIVVALLFTSTIWMWTKKYKVLRNRSHPHIDTNEVLCCTLSWPNLPYMSWVRCPFGPPDPALARVRTGPLNFVLHLAMPYAPPRRARAAHGLQRQPKPVPVGLFHDGPARNSTTLCTHLGGPKACITRRC
jgi:hypothetical protein